MLQSPKNPFKGINPFLMSFLQSAGTAASPSTYPSFQADHITHVKDFLNRNLPPQYIALSEPSLQIQGRDSEWEQFQQDSRVIPDITIYKPQAGATPSSFRSSSPSLELELEVEEQREWMSVVIREFKAADHRKHGEAIMRIELLSPANMLNGSYAEAYQYSRQKAILSQTKLLEIDYLHEFRSPVLNLPPYPQHPQAKAYNICLSQADSHKVLAYFWAVDEFLPKVHLPLKGDDSIVFDFNEPYNYTWENSRLWFYLDYEQASERLETYHADDQVLIRQRMAELAASQK